MLQKLQDSFILAVKRLMREAQELAEATYDYYAQPLSDNLFEWHFTVRGPADTEFDGGIYHGRIVLPPDYPMKPPNIIVLTVRLLLILGQKSSIYPKIHTLKFSFLTKFTQL